MQKIRKGTLVLKKQSHIGKLQVLCVTDLLHFVDHCYCNASATRPGIGGASRYHAAGQSDSM